MLQAAMRVIDPALADRLESEGRVLHAASQHSGGYFHTAAENLKLTASEASNRIASADLSSPEMVRAILIEVVSDSRSRRYTNYAGAEQALFAVQRLTAALGMAGPDMKAAVERASKQVQSPYAYNQNGFRTALGDIGAMLVH